LTEDRCEAVFIIQIRTHDSSRQCDVSPSPPLIYDRCQAVIIFSFEHMAGDS